MEFEIDCPKCQKPSEAKQDENHSEYAPVGKCENCGCMFFVVLSYGYYGYEPMAHEIPKEYLVANES